MDSNDEQCQPIQPCCEIYWKLKMSERRPTQYYLVPHEGQKLLCKRLGIPIERTCTRSDVKMRIDNSKNDPTFAKKWIQICAEDKEQQERSYLEQLKEIRDEHGIDIAKSFAKWEKISCLNDQFVLIFRQGKRVICEIAYCESAELVEGRKASVQIDILLPKTTKTKFCGEIVNELNWEKSKRINAKNVLYIQRLRKDIEIDYEQYTKIIAKAEKHAEKFRLE